MDTASQNSTFNIDSTAPETYQGLIPPRIPDAIYDEDHEGLLPLTMLGKPLRVEFSGWLAIRPDDICQLLWNGALIGEIKTITTEQNGDPLFLDIPAEYLVEGVFTVAYRATNTRNNVHEDSPAVRLKIVMTPPGLPKLAPMKFPDVIDCGLTSVELAGLGDLLIAEIGSYAGIYQHDVIRTFWGDIEGPGVIVSHTDTGLNRIRVVYTKAFLLSLGDFEGYVTYTVKDRAGNISEPSLGTYMRLLFNDAPECFKDRASNNIANPAHHSDNVIDITLRLQSFATLKSK